MRQLLQGAGKHLCCPDVIGWRTAVLILPSAGLRCTVVYVLCPVLCSCCSSVASSSRDEGEVRRRVKVKKEKRGFGSN